MKFNSKSIKSTRVTNPLGENKILNYCLLSKTNSELVKHRRNRMMSNSPLDKSMELKK